MKREAKFWIIVSVLVLAIIVSIVGIVRAGERKKINVPKNRVVVVETQGQPLLGIQVQGAKLIGYRFYLKERKKVDVHSYSYHGQRIKAYRLDSGREIEFPCLENILYIEELRSKEGSIARFVIDTRYE